MTYVRILGHIIVIVSHIYGCSATHYRFQYQRLFPQSGQEFIDNVVATIQSRGLEKFTFVVNDGVIVT